jgi:hypothetical protein
MASHVEASSEDLTSRASVDDAKVDKILDIKDDSA